jgi:3-phenylpropionate/cinnamic acid dioxygenase small subunit
VDTALARLQDTTDITAVQVQYAMALDAREWESLRACFVPDAVADYGDLGRFEGYDAIEALCRAALTPLTRSQHLLGNHVATVDGDEATAQCYFQAQHLKTGTAGGETFIIAGKYDDVLTRTPAGWRIRHRTLETWWTDGNAAVVGA